MHPNWDAWRESFLTEVTIENDDPIAVINHWYSVLILHVGNHISEVTYTSDESRAAMWIKETLKEQRHLRQCGRPLVVSLCAFKGVSYSKKSRNLKGPTGHPNHPSNPYLAISICLGGSHVLLYCHHGYNGANCFSIKPLEHLVEDKKVVVVGVQIKEIAKKLQDQCGLQIKCPVDLRLLIAGAYGKDSLKFDLEEMARIPLNGIILEKKPAWVLEADWSSKNYQNIDEEQEMELIKYAARDAFISYEIAAMCIQKTGLPSEAAYWTQPLELEVQRILRKGKTVNKI